MDNHELVQKTVVLFQKDGPAVYHSHHDMIRFWERAITRAALPVRMTQGFNPRPRIIFPHALGLGIASQCEQVEIELYKHVDNQMLLEKIKAAAGDTLTILKAFDLPPVKKSRQINSTSYEITGWGDDFPIERLQAAAAAVLALPEIIAQRGAPGKQRSLDVRPYVISLQATTRAASHGDDASKIPVLDLRLRHSPTGTARPDEIATVIAKDLDIDKYALSIHKTGMELSNA